jgi:N-methylhydantoinase A
VAGKTPKPDLAPLPRASAPLSPLKMIDVWLDGKHQAVPLYARADLLAGHAFAGPCVVSQDDCTTCVPPGFDCRVDDYGNLFIRARRA